MDNTVFYSWQSDLSRRYTRDLIHEAASQALSRIATDETIEDCPRLDHDTLDIAGAPEIAATIFRKIENCSVFLADVSFIGETASDDTNKTKKKLANPNVLIELGYAAATIGWSRIILVMNTKYGGPSELSFDLIHRRFPIRFEIGPESKDRLESVRISLSAELEGAIRLAEGEEHLALNNAIGSLDVDCLNLMRNLGHAPWFNSPSQNTMGEIMSLQWFFRAVTRLLNLRLIFTEVSPDGRAYAYHWTRLGSRVNSKLGFRKPPDATVSITT